MVPLMVVIYHHPRVYCIISKRMVAQNYFFLRCNLANPLFCRGDARGLLMEQEASKDQFNQVRINFYDSYFYCMLSFLLRLLPALQRFKHYCETLASQKF